MGLGVINCSVGPIVLGILAHRQQLKKVEAIVRPSRLESIKSALAEGGVTGLTVSDVRGSSAAKEGSRSMFRGAEYVIHMPAKARLEMTVTDDFVDEVIGIVLEHAQTGEPGDGVIFVSPVSDSVRIRTGENGESVLQ